MSDFYRWREQRKISSLYGKLATNPVAYFCMEFALPENLPIYAGGLGVLAGDYVMEASQQSFPMVGISLFYPDKCFIGEDGGYCVQNDAEKLHLAPVNDKLGNRIYVSLPIGKEMVRLQAWLYNRGTVPVYLLDGDLPENSKASRESLRLLYDANPESRLRQELVLGIAGSRLLDALGIVPSIYHMNEGHSAFLSFELAYKIMKKQGLPFSDAFLIAKKQIAFTNHTLVVGGHDVFDNKLVAMLLENYSRETGISLPEMIIKGSDKKHNKVFSATFLALNSASVVNAVSVLHGAEANKLWPEYPTVAVTNGVNIDRWDRIGRGNDIEAKHRQNKRELLAYIRENSGVKWRDDDLLVSWARRIVSYKRPISLFGDMSQLKKLLSDRRRPLRIAFSGNPHYHDKEGILLLNFLRNLSRKELKGKMVFLEKYNLELSSKMASGSDVWLNTPIVGLEACGTSGMKAALNGVLPCSTDDGWLPEVDLEKIGFKLDDQYITFSLLDTLREKIIPLYYQHQKNGSLSDIWLEKMQWSRQEILHHFGSDRMLRDYIEKVYRQILANQ